jgi:CheY-like chemotaxis protein
MLTSEQFTDELRHALNHLYDHDRLKKSALIPFMGIADRFDAPSALQRILLEAIQAFRPGTSEPVSSMKRRIFQVLSLRYEQQFHQQEIANQIGLSLRQYRRLQEAAIGELASKLVVQFGLSKKFEQILTVTPDVQELSKTEISEEIAWINNLPSNLPSQLQDLLPGILSLAKPLANRQQKELIINISDPLPEITMHPQVLRQVVLNLINAMILLNSGGAVSFSARRHRWDVEICASAHFTGREPVPESAFPSLNITRAMIAYYGGKLDFSANQQVFLARVILPAIDQIPVLMIDDNTDALNLFQHYTYGTRYRLVASRDPLQAIELAETNTPQVVLIDIMMPNIDGWEVLMRLKNHPVVGRIPVIVCTVLDQTELALSLGASGFLRKPVTRQVFLKELDHQIEQLG